MRKTLYRQIAALSIALLCAFCAPAFAQEEGEHQHEEKPAKKQKAPDLKNLPSRSKPEPKTCAGRCDADKGDCEYICKQVGNASAAASCKGACSDVQKECNTECKNGG